MAFAMPSFFTQYLFCIKKIMLWINFYFCLCNIRFSFLVLKEWGSCVCVCALNLCFWDDILTIFILQIYSACKHAKQKKKWLDIYRTLRKFHVTCKRKVNLPDIMILYILLPGNNTSVTPHYYRIRCTNICHKRTMI
jgi:hypothetical protein